MLLQGTLQQTKPCQQLRTCKRNIAKVWKLVGLLETSELVMPERPHGEWQKPRNPQFVRHWILPMYANVTKVRKENTGTLQFPNHGTLQACRITWCPTIPGSPNWLIKRIGHSTLEPLLAQTASVAFGNNLKTNKNTWKYKTKALKPLRSWHVNAICFAHRASTLHIEQFPEPQIMTKDWSRCEFGWLS